VTVQVKSIEALQPEDDDQALATKLGFGRAGKNPGGTEKSIAPSS